MLVKDLMELQKFITEVVKISNQIKSVDEQLKKIRISRSQIRKIVADFEKLQNLKMIRDEIENVKITLKLERHAVECAFKVDEWISHKIEAIVTEQIGFLETEIMKYIPKEMPLGDGGGEFAPEYYAEKKKPEKVFTKEQVDSFEEKWK